MDGLVPATAYSYTVTFDGGHPQTNPACGFTTDAAQPPPSELRVADAERAEPRNGEASMVFTVSRDSSAAPVDVHYDTVEESSATPMSTTGTARAACPSNQKRSLLLSKCR